MKYETELAEIDNRYKDKTLAKEAMEEFLALKGLDKENRLGTILDYILSLAKAGQTAKAPEPTKAEQQLKELKSLYLDIAKTELASSISDKGIDGLDSLIANASKELDKHKSMLSIVSIIEVLNN